MALASGNDSATNVVPSVIHCRSIIIRLVRAARQHRPFYEGAEPLAGQISVLPARDKRINSHQQEISPSALEPAPPGAGAAPGHRLDSFAMSQFLPEDLTRARHQILLPQPQHQLVIDVQTAGIEI